MILQTGDLRVLVHKVSLEISRPLYSLATFNFALFRVIYVEQVQSVFVLSVSQHISRRKSRLANPIRDIVIVLWYKSYLVLRVVLVAFSPYYAS